MEGRQQQQQSLHQTSAERIVSEFGQHFALDEESARANNIKYFLVRIIGQGASAVVWQIKQTTTGVPFALKFVDLSTMVDADKQRARAELDCLVCCDIFTVLRCHEEFVKFNKLPKTHIPNANAIGAGMSNTSVNQINPKGNGADVEDTRLDPDANLDDPRLFALVLDFANAGDLRMEIKNRSRANRPFREHEAGLLFLQVLLAVHHVHSKHMIHRDIKSANVLLCTNGLLKLGDFGFSRIYHNATVSDNVGRTFCGTPYYVAPEIWRRRPYSKKADIFSIGVLLYELLTLKRPFDGTSVQDVMERTLGARYEPLPDTISGEMRQLVALLLADNPDNRPTTTQLLKLPISKLFLDALMGIVLTQAVFDEQLKDDIRSQVKALRESLSAKTKLQQRLTLAGQRQSNSNNTSQAQLSTTSPVTAGIAPAYAEVGGMQLNQDDILCEGMLKKLSIEGSWKKRFLCIVHRPNGDETGKERVVYTTDGSQGTATVNSLLDNPPKDPPEHYDLVLAVTKEGAAQQCIVTNFSELEDVFPVPYKYAGPGLQHVFAIAFKSGVKRLTFQAATAEERDAWRVAIQQVLGLDDE